MRKFTWNNVNFIKSCVEPKDYPKLVDIKGNELFEVAIAGRSNVGKSSLLNDLFGVRNFAKTSATPGKTQLINFFTVSDQLAFVDLPGYGYAKVPREIKDTWAHTIDTYFRARKQLQLLFFCFDIRREPVDDDLLLLDWAHHYKKPLYLILTKVDKVKPQEKKLNTEKILAKLPYEVPYLHSSAKTHEGRFEIRKLLENV
jgi:GTP-binding protein